MEHDDLVHALYMLGMRSLHDLQARLEDYPVYRPTKELLVVVKEAIELLDTDIGTALGEG